MLCVNVDKKLCVCKQRQAYYYNKGAKDLEELKLGDVIRIFPIGSGAKEPLKAIVQSKSQEPFYRSFPVKSFKGMTTPTREDVNISLSLKEQHVTEYTTVFPATASEQKPATNPPEPDRRAEPQSPVKQTASNPIQTTRSGRVVKSPAHFQEYI